MRSLPVFHDASGVRFRRVLIQGRERNGAVKLFGFRRAGQCGRGRIAARDDPRDFIEVAGADEALMRDGAIAEFLRGDLFLLQLRVRGHASL